MFKAQGHERHQEHHMQMVAQSARKMNIKWHG